MRELEALNHDLKLWRFDQAIGKGLPLWLPNGAIIRNVIEDFWKDKHISEGYSLVYSPHIGNAKLWDQSMHTDVFADRMYPKITVEKGKEEYFLRPMNCPFHISIFNAEARSHKELPVRYAELGTVYRKIKKDTVKEMFEDRGFTQDDAHIFCERSKVEEELERVLKLTSYFLDDVFRIGEYKLKLKLRPDDAGGSGDDWDWSQETLDSVLRRNGLSFDSLPGEGLFYGPKVDFEITDPLYKKPWACSTVQLDILLANRFGVQYRDKQNRLKNPVIIHRTILGSLERFLAILITKLKGHLPLWLAPCQVILLPVPGKQFSNLSHAENAKLRLEGGLAPLNARIRIDRKERNIKEVSRAVREAIQAKVPYIITIGEREIASQKLSVRSWNGSEYTTEQDIPVDTLINELRDKIQSMV